MAPGSIGEDGTLLRQASLRIGRSRRGMCRGLSGEAFSVCSGGDTGRRRPPSHGFCFGGRGSGRSGAAATQCLVFGTRTLSDVDREGRGVEPGRLAKPEKRSGPNVSSAEGHDSDVGRGRGRQDRVLPGGGCRSRLVETVTGRSGPALWSGVRTACGTETRANCRPVGSRGAGLLPSGEGRAPRWNAGRCCIESRYADRRRGGNRRSGHRNR